VIAERLLRARHPDEHQARSAGSDPAVGVHPEVLQALRELGIDAGDHVPRKLDAELIEWADVVVSTCGEEACPVTPPGTRRIYWNVPDPKGKPLKRVREIRDEIDARVEELAAQLG
jgi:arsenate reductase (thioredoxin)